VRLSIYVKAVYAYFVCAVVDVHDLIIAAPALARTLLEDSNRVLVTARPETKVSEHLCEIIATGSCSQVVDMGLNPGGLKQSTLAICIDRKNIGT
jgi:hypothetical protein